MREIVQAIGWLVALSQPQTELYANLIQGHSERNGFDPLLMVALIHRESRFRRNLSSKGNHGLLQVRVSRTTNRDLIGKEEKLYRPAFNFRRGMALLRLWKRYHDRACAPFTWFGVRWYPKGEHWWHSHYQHGAIVWTNDSGIRVRRLYDELVRKFRKRVSSS